MLANDPSANRPVSSLYDLATWARRAGFEPVGLEVSPRTLAQLPLPAVLHFEPGHFVALHEVNDAEVTVSDQLKTSRAIPRDEFERLFSGYVLCLLTTRTEPTSHS